MPKKKADKGAKKYDCPSCGGLFAAQEKVGEKKDRCPHCNIKLKILREKKPGKGTGFKFSYVVAEPDSPETKQAHLAKNVPVEPEQPEGVLVSTPGEQPEIWLVSPGKSLDNGRYKDRRYSMTFRDRIHQGMIYCPGCWGPLFQNTVIHSGGLAQNHECRKCKSIVAVECIVTGKALGMPF